MGESDQDNRNVEIEYLRQALDAETRRRLELQRMLDRANADFEEFISMAAHNLREPLRDVLAFSQLLTEEGRLDSEAIDYVVHVQQGSARMQTVLDGVVDYWAAGTGDWHCSPTDMEATLRQALLRADSQMAERSAIITHDPLPTVEGDSNILSKVLHHLIRNAIEYCDVPSPHIHISCQRADTEWVFSVNDNGPGIDPEFHGRLFRAFKRLHGGEHPGNGLGLAFCKKAIEGHGGRIWVESAAGTGSTFYFTVAIEQKP